MVRSTPFRLERHGRKKAANHSKRPGSRSTHPATPTRALADLRNKNRQKILSKIGDIFIIPEIRQ